MAGQFSFSFSGEDIDAGDERNGPTVSAPAADPAPTTATATPASAFPVAGKPLLPATSHDLSQMLSELPSKIAYGLLDVDFGDGAGDGEEAPARVRLPRRELWDVRVQLMAEDESAGELEPGLGNHDVRTGIYEGGFKSWESSVDLVKVLRPSSKSLLSADEHSTRIIEVRFDNPNTYLMLPLLTKSAAGLRHGSPITGAIPVGPRLGADGG